MSLQAQLAAARAQAHARRSRALPPRPRKHALVERAAAALFARDFLNDLDALLKARGATLWVVWKGKRGQVYVHSADGYEVLIESHRTRRTVTPDFSGEIGQRIYRLMELHDITLGAAWRNNEYSLQAGNTHVSDEYCLSLVRCGEGRKAQYCNELEQPHV